VAALQLHVVTNGAANARPPVPPDDDDPPVARPVHRIEKGRGDEAIAALLGALAKDEDLYERDHALVHVVGAEERDEADARAPVAQGTPIVRSMVQATLWERASKCIAWEKYDGRAKHYVPTDPPAPVLANMIARGDYPGIRRLTGIIGSPGLRPDGTLIFGRGWDAATGFLCVPTIDFLPPSPEPTKLEGAEALAKLRAIFADFPHRDEAARMVPVAAILTVLARPAIRGAVPAFIFDANTRGSGKTMQADAVALITTGRVPPPMSYPHDDIELEKVLGAYALKGPPIIKLDNVTRTFGGGPIDRVLTAVDTVEMRVLGRSEIPELPWRSVVLVTGNNVSMTGDTSRRVLMCRMESPLENPEERPVSDFKHPDLLAWIAGNRAKIVRAALTVLRAWVCAGRPAMECRAWGSFVPWSSLVPPAITFCGGTDPMLARPSATGEEEPEKAAIIGILEGLSRLDASTDGLTVRQILAALYPSDRGKHDAPPDGYDDFRDALEFLSPARGGFPPDSKKLGERMRHLAKDRVIGGRKLTASKAGGNVQRWRVVQVDR
jgi:hypothetical protein